MKPLTYGKESTEVTIYSVISCGGGQMFPK